MSDVNVEVTVGQVAITEVPEKDENLADKLGKISLLEGGTPTPGGLGTPAGPTGDNDGSNTTVLTPAVKVGILQVHRRIKALKKVQVEMAETESEFFKEMHALEMKYSPRYDKLFAKREEIISGKYEPNDEDCNFKVDADTVVQAEGGENPTPDILNIGPEVQSAIAKGDAVGIPNFWLTIFQNVSRISELVQEQDHDVLKHLQDIKVELTQNPPGFQLQFHFAPNEFFANGVLTKSYELKFDVDEEDPFSYEGPEIVKCSGCSIDWKEGKDLTVRVIQKKQKHKQTGVMRTVSKNEKNPSFFDFFNPPELKTPVDSKAADEVDDDEEDVQFKLTCDFEIGQYFRERIIPKAVLYFTGEAMEDDYSTMDEEDEEEEEEEEEEDTTDAESRSRGSGN